MESNVVQFIPVEDDEINVKYQSFYLECSEWHGQCMQMVCMLHNYFKTKRCGVKLYYIDDSKRLVIVISKKKYGILYTRQCNNTHNVVYALHCSNRVVED